MRGWDVWGGVLTSPRAVRHYLCPASAPAAVAGCFVSCVLRAPSCCSRGARGGGGRLHPPAGAPPARGPGTSLQDPGDPRHSVRMEPCSVSAVVPNPRQSVLLCGFLGLGQRRGAGRGVQPACPLHGAFVASWGRILSGAEVTPSLSAGAQLCPGKGGPRPLLVAAGGVLGQGLEPLGGGKHLGQGALAAPAWVWMRFGEAEP